MPIDDADDLPVMGGCLCNEVSFRVRGPLGPVIACHCQQCRRSSGHYWATTTVPRENIEVEGELRWYRSSDTARRAFCPDCGSSLFWDDGGRTIAIAAGTLDKPTGLSLTRHIFCADKGDYYTLEDGLPQDAGSDERN